MRIPVLLIAGLIALGPAAHAAEAPSDNVAPVAAPEPAPAPAGRDAARGGPEPAIAPEAAPAPRGGSGSRADAGPRGGPAARRPRLPWRPLLPRRSRSRGGSRLPPLAAARPRRRLPRPARAGSRPIPGPRGPIPHVPVDGLHRRRSAGPHQVHERADEEELHLRRAGAGEDHDHLPPPGNAGRGVRRLPLRAAVEGVHHRLAGEHDQDHRRAGSAPGHHPHRRFEGYRLRGVHHPPRSAAVPREHRGRPAGDAAGLQGRDGLRVRFLQYAAADRLAREYRPDRHDHRGGRQRGGPRDPPDLPAGLRRRDRCREDLDLHLPGGRPGRGGGRERSRPRGRSAPPAASS